MKVSVVVTVLNEEKTVEKLIRALFSQTKKPDEVIIVDGGSTDKTLSEISNIIRQPTDQISNKFPQNKKPKLKVLIKAGNRAVGRNYGIVKSKNQIIALTDAGGYPDRDWLGNITHPFTQSKIQAVAGFYRSLARTPFEKCITPYFLVMPDKVRQDMEFLPSSRSIAFRKTVWKKVGGYPEQFSHNEDLVFDYAVKKQGISFFFEPTAIVWWQPPENIFAAAFKFFRFSLGDAQSGIKRPKILLVFLRYALGLILIILELYALFATLFTLYILWSIWKNWSYAKLWQAFFWLPIIQVVSDISVMSGHVVGLTKGYDKRYSISQK